MAVDPISPDLSDPSPAVAATETAPAQAQTADAAIPMWVVALIGRQQLELELLRDQVQRAQQPPTAGA